MSAWARARMSFASVSARAMRSARTDSAACRASSMSRPASFLASAICARYCAFAASASVFAVSAPSRSLRMRSSRACSMFFTAGTPNFHTASSSTTKAAEPHAISLPPGSNGDGAFWQSLISPPFTSFSAHCFAASFAYFGAVSAPYAGAATTKTATAMPTAAISARMCFRTVARLAGDDEREDETEQRERLGERDPEEHRRANGGGRLGLARQGGDRVADDQTDADAGADGGAAVDDA